MIKFSIIIPVYNTPFKYLRKCIDSIRFQTYSDLEIIVIDDGSNDFETLQYLSELSNELTVLHKSNGGQATARNLGIENANGNYIVFVDSDDYWLSDSLLTDVAQLLDESQADILSFSYAEFFDESKQLFYCSGTLPRTKVFGKTKETARKALLKSSRKAFSSVTHTKVIKTEFLRKNNIHFIENLNNEDTFFTIQIIQLAESYDRLNKVGYAFRRNNPDSDTQNPKKQLKIERDMITVFNYLFESGEPTEITLDFLGSSFVYWMGKVVRLQAMGLDMHNDIEEMKKYKYVMCYSSRWYVKIMGYFTQITGLPLALKVLDFYLRLNSHHVLSINRKIRK